MARSVRTFGLGIFVAAMGLLVYFGLFGFELEENLGLHLMIRARGVQAPPEEVLVISMDKPAADSLGLEADPQNWPRTIHARLIDRLASAGASVIVFDIFFREAGDTAEDGALAEAISRAGNVILFAYLRRDRAQVRTSDQVPSRVINVERLIAPTDVIAAAAVGLAPFALPKTKIKVSQFWTFRRSAGDRPTLPAMALQLFALEAYDDFVRLLGAIDPEAVSGLPQGAESLFRPPGLSRLMDRLKRLFSQSPDLADVLLRQLESDPLLASKPYNRRLLAAMIDLYRAGSGRYLNFYGPPRSVPTISYADMLEEARVLPDLTRKVVFVGYSAGFQPDQKDAFYTAYSQADGLDISGVEIAATAFANLMERSSIRPLAPWPFILTVIAYGFVAVVVSRTGPALYSIGLSTVFAAAYCLAAFGIFFYAYLWVPVAVPVLVQSPLALVSGLAVGYWETRRERNRIRHAFGHYIPNDVVDQLLQNPGAPLVHQELRYGICLATDAEQYTELAESMAAGALQSHLNRYYRALFEPVRAHGGVVSDVIGDAMLAIWSAGKDDVAMRAQACLAAVEIARNAETFNARSLHQLPTRIGLHAGELSLGNVGALDHYEYRAVGDIVNTASRIQGVNKILGTRILVSPEVIDGVRGFWTRELGSFRVVGKQQAIALYELIGKREGPDSSIEALLTSFAEALDAYRDRAWQRAMAGFSRILEAWPSDGPARFYYNLCVGYSSRPPTSAWNPTILLKEK